MATFTFTPDFDAERASEPRVRRSQFADGGYEHRIRFGLNTDPKTFNFTFANRSDTEADQIESFFSDLGAAEAFDWSSSIGARRNLLTYSEDVTRSAWTTWQLTAISSGIIGFAGGSNAFGLVPNTSINEHNIQQTLAVPASTNTVNSVFLKQGNGRDAGLYVFGATNQISVTLNFSTQTAANTSSGGTTVTGWSAERIGSDGWWRIWITGRPDNGTSRIFRVITTSTSGLLTYAGNGTSNQTIFMGPQLEYGSLTDYQPTLAAPPPQKWVCERWNRRWLNCNNNTVTATFRQVFES